MNMIRVALSPLISDTEIFFPDTVSGRKNSGAFIPSAGMVEGVLAIG
jgi:hypothetical protein